MQLDGKSSELKKSLEDLEVITRYRPVFLSTIALLPIFMMFSTMMRADDPGSVFGMFGVMILMGGLQIVLVNQLITRRLVKVLVQLAAEKR